MTKIKSYLDPSVKPNAQTSRAKMWAYDNAFTLFWLHIVEIALLIYLVVFR